MTMQAPGSQSVGEQWNKERRQIFSQEALDKMRSPEQLDTVLPITTPIGWIGLLSVAVMLLAVVLWSIFGSLTVTAEGMGLIMDAGGVLYLPLEKGRQVEVGQTVHLAPNGVDVSQTGSLLGTVSSVSQHPVSLQDIRKGLESEQLARWIFQTQQGAVMEVHFDLVKDDSSASGYLWTSSAGEHTPVTAGSLCTGSIIIERHPPIEKIFCRLSQRLRNR